ncbi:MAG: ABC transporter ATP-binding protein [Chloroflexi bacterium]|nr:ABC transporter ATP-binding protein [Chloroflexota bacterium]
MRYLLRLNSYIKVYKRSFAIAWLCVIGAAVFQMASPLLVRYAIDFGLKPVRGAGGKVVGLDGNENLLIFGAAAVILFAIGRGLASFGQQFLGESVGQKVAYDIRNGIYNNLQRLSYAYHDNAQTGQIMSRVTQDVESIRMYINMGLLRVGYIVLILLISVVGMFVINWQLALVSVVSIPILIWRSFIMAQKVRPVWMQIQQNQAEMTQVAEEGLSGIRVVKAFSREDFESEKFREASTRQANLSYRSSQIMAWHAPLMMGLGQLQIAATVGFGAWLISRGSLTAADLLTFTLWLNLLQLPVRMAGFAVTFFSRAITSSERIFELIDAQSAVQEHPGAQPLGTVEGHVRFEGVGFSYNSLSAVLADVDIDARPGQVIALLGPTGSGKSTVVNLIPRFYDVTSGRITIDGTDIREVTLDSLRKNIGIVQQDVFLFLGTIRDNIAYGRPEATQEDVERAAKAARIHDFIVSLPYGYDEWVGERGVTLSGGQKQRLAIARTLLMDPKILIFDDSTASVDSQTEFLIQQALQELMHGRTTFVIAQRLRTVMRADEIIVLERGRVVQRGKHAELLEQEGLYRRIFDLELRDQEEALGRATPGAGGAPPAAAPGGRAPVAPSQGARQAAAPPVGRASRAAASGGGAS